MVVPPISGNSEILLFDTYFIAKSYFYYKTNYFKRISTRGKILAAKFQVI